MSETIGSELLRNLRKRLDTVFHPDTAAPGTPPGGPKSAGHCAAVAIVLKQFFGGTFRSVKVNGASHWYNRTEEGLDVDLTGDQFGAPPVRCGKDLYPDSQERKSSELNDETRDRAYLLMTRLGFNLGRYNATD